MSGDSVRGSLQSNYAELTENLELDAQIIARLQQDNLISRDCAQRIRKKETTMDKNEVLLDWALGHWDESFLAQFCDVLDQYSASQPRHKVLAEKIRTEFNKRAGECVLTEHINGIHFLLYREATGGCIVSIHIIHQLSNTRTHTHTHTHTHGNWHPY